MDLHERVKFLEQKLLERDEIIERERQERDEIIERKRQERDEIIERERQERDEIIERERRERKKAEETRKKFSKENKFLRELYELGMPNLRFMKTVTKDTTHTSDHEAIYYNKSNSVFNILSNLDEYINEDILDLRTSSFLNYCMTQEYCIQYADEAEAKVKLEMYIDDLINCTKIPIKASNGSIGLKFEDNVLSTKTSKYKTSLTPDLWCIMKNDFRPIFVVEFKIKEIEERIKNNNIKSIIEYDEVIGQIYDYLMKLKNFYGQRYVFGVITSLYEWKICWLNDTDKYAAREYVKGLGLKSSRYSQNSEREICSTEIYKHNDKNLSKIIISAIAKSYESPYYPVPIFSTNRNYVRLIENNWQWTRYDEITLSKLNKNLTLNNMRNNKVGFTVLKYFKGGRYSKVRLAVADNGSFVILKEFDDDISNQSIETEYNCWVYGNKIMNVYIETIVNRRTLVMPLVFTVHEKNGKLYIPINLQIWSVENGAIPDILPENLEKINIQLKNYNNYPDLEELCEVAIDKLATAGYRHKDLKYRHLGVYPVIRNGKLVRVEPVLIDFDVVDSDLTYDEAYSLMKLDAELIVKEYNSLEYIYN